MVHFPVSADRRQYSALPFVLIAGLLVPTVLLIAPRAIANDFEACTRSLTAAGLEDTVAAGACGQALRPADLARCTAAVTDAADVAADQALVACQSDRRPLELATCVSDIHQSLAVTSSTAVLNNCRRSVLPVRFADCVVGVAAATDLTSAQSMAQCIAAGYQPQDVAPTFIFSR